MCFQRKNSHNLTHFRKKSMGVTAQKLKEVLNLIKSKEGGNNFGKITIFWELQKIFFKENWAKHHQFSIGREGVKEKSCFLRTLSQFMFTYWFKKFRVVFHTHALWQKFIVHRFFFYTGKKCKFTINFSKKGRLIERR